MKHWIKRLYVALPFSLLVIASACSTQTAAPSSAAGSSSQVQVLATQTGAGPAAATAPAKATVPAAAAPAKAPEKVTIAYQFGLGYSPLIVVKQQGILAKQFPNTKIEWKILSSGSAVRDAMIAGQVQIGGGGSAPFLVGWDKGVGWKLLSSLNDQDLWLVVKDPNIKSLRDFKPEHKIGTPAPDSIQAITLRKGAQDQLGNAKALDNNIAAIAHPDGVQSLAGGQLAGHLSSPPYQFDEVAAGGHVILKGVDVFGRNTAAAIFVLQTFYDQYPDFSKALHQDIADATKLIKEKPDEAAKYLSDEQGGNPKPEQFKAWFGNEAVSFGTAPRGFLKVAAFMKSIGFISKAPASIDEIELPTIAGSGD